MRKGVGWCGVINPQGCCAVQLHGRQHLHQRTHFHMWSCCQVSQPVEAFSHPNPQHLNSLHSMCRPSLVMLWWYCAVSTDLCHVYCCNACPAATTTTTTLQLVSAPEMPVAQAAPAAPQPVAAMAEAAGGGGPAAGASLDEDLQVSQGVSVRDTYEGVMCVPGHAAVCTHSSSSLCTEGQLVLLVAQNHCQAA